MSWPCENLHAIERKNLSVLLRVLSPWEREGSDAAAETLIWSCANSRHRPQIRPLKIWVQIVLVFLTYFQRKNSSRAGLSVTSYFQGKNSSRVITFQRKSTRKSFLRNFHCSGGTSFTHISPADTSKVYISCPNLFS